MREGGDEYGAYLASRRLLGVLEEEEAVGHGNCAHALQLTQRAVQAMLSEGLQHTRLDLYSCSWRNPSKDNTCIRHTSHVRRNESTAQARCAQGDMDAKASNMLSDISEHTVMPMPGASMGSTCEAFRLCLAATHAQAVHTLAEAASTGGMMNRNTARDMRL